MQFIVNIDAIYFFHDVRTCDVEMTSRCVTRGIDLNFSKYAWETLSLKSAEYGVMWYQNVKMHNSAKLKNF